MKGTSVIVSGQYDRSPLDWRETLKATSTLKHGNIVLYLLYILTAAAVS